MEVLDKPKCKYGKACYRRSIEHSRNYNHDPQDSVKENSPPEEKFEEASIDKIELGILNDKEKIEIRRESLEKNQTKKRKISSEGLTEPVDKIELAEVKNIRDLVLEHNQMQMPEDFYDLIEFCKFIKPKDPKTALDIIDIELTGIYDLVLSGLKLNYKTHSRYYYDVPEFQTVLNVVDSNTLLHFGYFRDEPNEMPNFVAINEAKLDGKIISKGDNIFAAIYWYISELLSKKTYSTNTSNDELNEFKKKFTEWCDTHYKGDKKFSLQIKTPKIKSREKKVVCKTMHQAGLVVSVDSRGFGYREVPETLESQKKMFTYCSIKDESGTNKAKKRKGDDDIQEIITLIQFANDESDYGMGLEFGLNMFSFGELALHKYIRQTLPVCYSLLGRDLYADIIREHLKNRKLTI